MRPSVLDGPGAMHIDRIAADCIGRDTRRVGDWQPRPFGPDASLRLEVAVIAATVLDQETT